jgi:FMN reductase
LTAIGISGSPSASSRSRILLEHALNRLANRGVVTGLIDLNELPADALLGRSVSAGIERALAAVGDADIVVASTPVYRATYAGLLKVFFDLFAHRALAGKVGLAIATGGAPGHQLVLDHGLRPLFASVGAVVVPTGVYAIDAEFDAGVPQADVLERIEGAVAESVQLAERSRIQGTADVLALSPMTLTRTTRP